MLDNYDSLTKAAIILEQHLEGSKFLIGDITRGWNCYYDLLDLATRLMENLVVLVVRTETRIALVENPTECDKRLLDNISIIENATQNSTKEIPAGMEPSRFYLARAKALVHVVEENSHELLDHIFPQLRRSREGKNIGRILEDGLVEIKDITYQMTESMGKVLLGNT